MDTQLAQPTRSDHTAVPLAAWDTKRPWLWAIVLGLAGTVLTAFGPVTARCANSTYSLPRTRRRPSSALSAWWGWR